MGILALAAAIYLVPLGCDALAGNVPMVLYGKVIDQGGNPVPGARVTFLASRSPRFTLPVPFYEGDYVGWTVEATTAPDGKFEVRPGRGKLLMPRAMACAGYGEATAPGAFDFTGTVPTEAYTPDAEHPVIFLMWNDRMKRILTRDGTANALSNETYSLRYITGRIEANVSGLEELTYTIKYPAQRGHGRYGWEIDLHAIDGGLVEARSPIGTRAPDMGYVPSLRVAVSADDPAWSTDRTVRFYTRGKSSEDYAAVEMRVRVPGNADPAMVSIHYVANFEHSPDLSPGPRVAAH